MSEEETNEDNETCAYHRCGLPLVGNETRKVDPQLRGRTDTKYGPMHFSCYWKFLREVDNHAD